MRKLFLNIGMDILINVQNYENTVCFVVNLKPIGFSYFVGSRLSIYSSQIKVFYRVSFGLDGNRLVLGIRQF